MKTKTKNLEEIPGKFASRERYYVNERNQFQKNPGVLANPPGFGSLFGSMVPNSEESWLAKPRGGEAGVSVG